MDIPGLATLYAILKRHIDRENDVFAQRKKLADDLMANCHKWAAVLLETFATAVKRWEIDGRDAAEKEIIEQEQDFLKLEYESLENDSPILLFLKEDPRFEEFANSWRSRGRCPVL